MAAMLWDRPWTPRLPLWKGICFMLVVCLATYYMMPVRSWSPRSFWDANPTDPFALHPEHHIFRAPRTVTLHWNVTRATRRPDGVLKQVYLVNGQFPGPTVEARSGDRVRVAVFNGITGDDGDEGIAIHWHGMTMRGFNEMDGVVGVSQCAVAPGSTHVYEFEIDPRQHGTFWYHAHSAVQRADGMYGGLVVHKPAGKGLDGDSSVYQYDAEKLLLIGDWYHVSADRVLAEYKDVRSSGNEPVPDSLLINGVGSYNCSNARPGKPVDCVDTEVPVVRVTGDSVRLRVVNVGASAGYSLQLANAALQLLTVDGGGPVSDATPRTSALGVLYPGERVDVVLRPGEKQQETVLKIALDPELMQLMNPALTRAQEFPLKWSPPDGRSSSERREVRQGDVVKVVNLHDARGPPRAALDEPPSDTLLLYTSLGINAFRNDEPWGELNHTSWVWKDPYARPLLAIGREAWEHSTEQANPLRTLRVPRLPAGQERWLDLVVNNVDDRGHTFHLHGHEFYVLASQQDELGRAYNPFASPDGAVIPAALSRNPLKKDTVYVMPRGYVILRLRPDNPGLWLMHCHVLWHQAVGMGMVLQVGDISEATARKAAHSCRGRGGER